MLQLLLSGSPTHSSFLTACGVSFQILWIGCSDSRVPPNETTGTRPGDIFVHRNVANQVIHADFNMLSVLQYAVEVLQVRDIIVCGHYGCGGVRAATTQTYSGLISKWIRHIKDTYSTHQSELSAIQDVHQRENRLVELNVEEQVLNLAQMGIVQRAWRRNGFHEWQHASDALPRLHGWIYNIENGLMKELPIDLNKVPEIYRLKFDDPLHPLPPGLHSYDLE
jgi:carbonic anhydrase